MTDQNVGRLGRQPLWTAKQAREILELRKAFEGSRITTKQFIEQLLSVDTLSAPCSEASMRRLLSGKMFPSLKAVDEDGNETDKFYDYSKVPQSPRGHPPAEERVDRATGQLMPVFTKRQKQWQEEILKRTELIAIASGEAGARQEMAAMRERFGAVLLELEKLRTELRLALSGTGGVLK